MPTFRELKQTNMDVARIMVRTKYNSVIKKTFNVQINYEVYWIKVVEYSKGLVRIIIPIMKTGDWEVSGEEDGKFHGTYINGCIE